MVRDEALKILREVFGHERFRAEQQSVIAHVAEGRNALAVMPTGSGKSLCYQIPALMRTGTAIVVSPLIALMNDQVRALKESGIAAGALNSATPAKQKRATLRSARDGTLKLLYLAPERLMMSGTLELLNTIERALFAIDEAHCISQWGHDFRPEYLDLQHLQGWYPETPRIALTATADGPTRREIETSLALERSFVSGLDRPNIHYAIVEKHNPNRQLAQFIEEHHANESGIVYCLSRRKTDKTAQWLRERGHRALAYHAGMDTKQRNAHQEAFAADEVNVMVATIAFGMGIDKPDVRFVAHLDLPKTIESYYQETGRAGRDGKPADAWMCYGLGDVAIVRHMVEHSDAPQERKRIETRKLNSMLGLCEVTTCRREALLAYFDDHTVSNCGRCDNCENPAAAWDATEAARKMLSCIYRTGGRFGAGHLVDVLRGKDTAKVRRWTHDQVSTFGIGADLDARTWHAVLRQLVARALAEVDVDGHGAVKLNAASRTVLRGECAVTLRRHAQSERARAGRGTRATRGASTRRTRAKGANAEVQEQSGAQAQRPRHEHMLEVVRKHRRTLARERQIAPYNHLSQRDDRGDGGAGTRNPRGVRKAAGRGQGEARAIRSIVHRGDATGGQPCAHRRRRRAAGVTSGNHTKKRRRSSYRSSTTCLAGMTQRIIAQ